MKRVAVCLILLLAGLFFSIGCGSKEKDQKELAVGNWTQFRNRAYILLITSPKGEWSSSVRIADATSKIVKSKGDAKGTWDLENGQIIFTVIESGIEKIWKKNDSAFFDIVELTESRMQLKDGAGRTIVWKKTNPKTAAGSVQKLEQRIPMGPVVVNLNKNRSNDKDRYLCLNLSLGLKELMPDQKIPSIHPKAREAVLIFLSSLDFNDVKDFDRIKQQGRKLVDVLNPYMEGFIQEVIIEHVIVATDADKVDEFIIEHTRIEDPDEEAAGQGEEK